MRRPRRRRDAAPPAGPARRFTGADGGNFAVMFALASLPLLAFTGAAIDYGMATRLQTKLQAAADATALGLCQTPLATTTAALQSQAQTVSLDYMGATSGVTVDALGITSNPRKITLTTHINSQTFFPKFTGVSSPVVTASSQCATPSAATFEIAMVLDNTGSMAESSGSQTKLQAVQQAASNFVDYVKTNGAFASDSRIAIVPFAAAVAVDPIASSTASWVDTGGNSAYHWTNVTRSQSLTSRLSIFNSLKAVKSNWGWAGCFETLPYPLNVQDGAPSTAANQAGWNTLYVPMFAPDEPGDGSTGQASWRASTSYYGFVFYNGPTYTTDNSYINDSNGAQSCPSTQSSFFTAESQACKYVSAKGASPNGSTFPNGPNYQCVSKPLQRLTTNSTTLKSLINSMAAVGSTNIYDGMIWGWRTLSPKSVFADGASYASTSTRKVIILMTDGTNTWPGNSSTPNGSDYFPLGYMTNADGSHPDDRLPPAYNYQTLTSDAQRRNALDELTQETCTNAKAAGISIYTIGFSVPSDPIDSQGLTLLQNCATSSKQAFVANDSNGLIAAFGQIAASIGALRVSQ